MVSSCIYAMSKYGLEHLCSKMFDMQHCNILKTVFKNLGAGQS